MMNTSLRNAYAECKPFLDQMKDKRIACFFKPSNDMSDKLVHAITDAVKNLSVDIKTSVHKGEYSFLIVRQDMPVERRMMIENAIKLLVYSHPTWIVVEECNGTTYTYMV